MRLSLVEVAGVDRVAFVLPNAQGQLNSPRCRVSGEGAPVPVLAFCTEIWL